MAGGNSSSKNDLALIGHGNQNHRNRIVSYAAGHGEIKIKNKNDRKKYRMISRSLNQDDFELFKEFNSSSSSCSSSSSDDDGNLDFKDDKSEDDQTLTKEVTEEAGDFFDKIKQKRRNTSVQQKFSPQKMEIIVRPPTESTA